MNAPLLTHSWCDLKDETNCNAKATSKAHAGYIPSVTLCNPETKVAAGNH